MTDGPGAFDVELWAGGLPAEPPDEPEPEQGEDVEPAPIHRPSIARAGAFPTAAMPAAYRDMIRAVAGNKQVPEELPAMLGLATVATVAASGIEIARGSGWVEPLNIYTVISMDSGTGKTPAEKDVTRPLWAIEKRLRADYSAVISNKVEQVQHERAAASKGSADAVRLDAELKALEEAKSAPPDLVLGSDTTIEVLSDLMSRNGGSGSIIDAEGEFFPILSGRYNGGVPNVGLVLKAYDGDRYKVRRIGRKQDDIERAVLTLGLGVQPVILEDAVKSKAMVERGLLARFIIVIPASLLGTRTDEGTPYDFDAMKAWSEAIERLHDYAAGLGLDENGDRPLLTLTARARWQHVRFCGWIERRLHPDDGDLGNMAGWAAKHKARALRIAGLLHLIDGRRVDEPVSETTMLASIEVCRWAVGHAVEAFRAGGALQEMERRCDDVMTWIRECRPEQFTVRIATRKVRKKWASEGGSAAIIEVLQVLCEEGHLTSTPEKNRAGHSCTVYRPHPLALIEEAAA